MKKNSIVRTALAGMFVLLTCGASASDTIPVAAGSRTFEMMALINPWTATSNASSLSLYDFGTLNLAQTGYIYENDEINLLQEPDITSAYSAATKGFMKLGKLSLFGSFRYSNSGFSGVNYNGTMMFNTLNPYLLGDTVSARQVREQFDIEGKVSYRLTDRLFIGGSVEYLSAVGSKQKDPRNKNTISSLKVSPGVIYNLGNTKIGLSGSAYTTSDEMSYKVEGNWNQNLFMFAGLGYFSPRLNISSYSEWYKGNGYGGAFQVSHDTRNLFMMAELSYDHFTEEARSGNSYRLIDGITATNDISLSGLLRIARGKAYHIITLNGTFKSLTGDEILQDSYYINYGTYTVFTIETVSWIENKHIINDIGGEVRYSYLVYDNDRNIDVELGGAIEAGYFSTEHFPVQTFGFYNVFNVRGSLFARKMFMAGSLQVTPGIDAGYRINLSSDMSYIVQTKSFPEMVYHDYYISKANVISVAASVRMELPFSQNNFIKSLFLIPKGSWAAAPGTEVGDLSGYMINATAGITF